MLDFYRTYYHPSSPTRAKTSIHLVASANAADIAASTSTDEKREKLVETVSSMLAQLGLEADTALLAKQFEKVDIASGDAEGIVGAVSAYMKEKLNMAADEVEGIMEQGKLVLAQVLPALGIVSAQEQQQQEQANGDVAPRERKAVVIEDVKAFKASMPLSAGARPVRELSEFEELGAKL